MSQLLYSYEDWVYTVIPGDKTQRGLGMPRRQALRTGPSELETSQSHQREPEKSRETGGDLTL